MCTYLEIVKLKIPSYGVMICVGLILSNIIGYIKVKKCDMNIYDLVILEAYTILGGFIGAKLLYIITIVDKIDFTKVKDISYINEIMKGGFVFYGGLILGAIICVSGGIITGIDVKEYIEKFIFLVPFVHAFGRIGCFMAGCCYGFPYEGVFAVEFPNNSYAPSGIKLFPIQIVESITLFLLFILLMYIEKNNVCSTIKAYLFIYSLSRFILEYGRFDSCRGKYLYFSTSQWISLIIMVVMLVVQVINKNVAFKAYTMRKKLKKR